MNRRAGVVQRGRSFGMKRACVTTVAAALLVAASTLVAAQPSYPRAPIRLIAPEVPGSATDILARILAAKLGEALGQRVTVINNFGEAGLLEGIKASPDGHTLIYGSAGTLALLPHIKKVSFDPLKDLTPVARFVISPTLLAVHPSLPIANVSDLVTLMKARPGDFKMATAGFGTAGHFAGVMFNAMAGVNPPVVHYAGGGPAIAAVIDNDAQWTFAPIAGRLPHVRTGKLKAIATGGARRLAVLPDVPTVAESGFPDYDSVGWGGIFVPNGTPEAVIDKLSVTIAAAIVTDDARDAFARQGTEPAPSTPAELARLLRADHARLGEVARRLGVKAE
jgi:tripartite-type tricarboxylate transporter receptor subunit TctC